MSRAQITFIRKTMATKTCKMIALFLKVIRSYMIPDTVGPQKLPRAKEEVNNPETTACTWWENGSVSDCNVKRLGWHLHAFREARFNCCNLGRAKTGNKEGRGAKT